jgi:hypothetical protein
MTVEELRGFYSGCFHDSITRSKIVDSEHERALAEKRADDDISSVVSEMILKHMLVELPSSLDGTALHDTSPWRRDAKTTQRLWTKRLKESTSFGRNATLPSMPIQTMSDSMDQGYSESIIDGPQRTPTTASAPPYRKSFIGQTTSDGAYSDSGTDHLSRTFSDRSSRPPLFSHTRQSLASQFSTDAREQLQINLHGNNYSTFGRSTMQEEPSQKPDKAMILRSLMSEMDNEAEEIKSQLDNMRLNNHTNERTVTVNEIYTRFILPKDGKSKQTGNSISKFRRNLRNLRSSSPDWENPLSIPQVKRAVDKLRATGDGGRNQVLTRLFIIYTHSL